MSDRTAAPHTRRALLLWFIVGTALCVVRDPLRLGFFSDNQHYFFIAERAASGVPPHASHFDPKHALGSLATAAAIAFGRSVGVGDVPAARALSIVVTGATFTALWLWAFLLFGRRREAHFAAAALAAFGDLLLMGTMGARPKVFAVFAAVVFLSSCCRRRPFVQGMGLAATFLCWQPAFLLAPALALPLVLEPRRARGAFAAASGFLLCLAVYEAYFWAHGALAAQLEQSYLFPLQHMGGTWPPRWRGLWLHAQWIVNWHDGPRVSTVVPLLGVAGLLLASVGVLRGREALLAWARDRGKLAATAGFIGIFPFILWNYQGFPDRFLLLPFLALGVAVVLAGATDAIAARSRRTPQAFGAACIAACVLIGLSAFRVPVGLPAQHALAREVGDMLADGRSVWALGCTHLLAFNHANNFSNIGFLFRGMGGYLRREQARGAFPPTRAGNYPDVILLSRGRRQYIETWLQRHYERVPMRAFQGQGIQVWRRAHGVSPRNRGRANATS